MYHRLFSKSSGFFPKHVASNGSLNELAGIKIDDFLSNGFRWQGILVFFVENLLGKKG